MEVKQRARKKKGRHSEINKKGPFQGERQVFVLLRHKTKTKKQKLKQIKK